MGDKKRVKTVFIDDPQSYDYLSTHGDATVKLGGGEAKFKPKFRSSKWDESCYLDIDSANTVVDDEEETLVNGVVELDVKGVKHKYYEAANGDLEYELIYDEEPNKIELSMDFPAGLEFYYQPELTQDEIDEGFFRPDNVVGSYAVYWNKESGKYKSGKFCHIYRPKLIDSLGTERWASMEIKNKKLTIDADFSGLSFPVRVDPTIGFTGTPGTNSNVYGIGYLTTGVAGSSMQASANGTCNYMYVYTATTSTLTGYVAIYDGSLNLLRSQAYSVGGSIGWHAVAVSALSIISGNTYYPLFISSSAAGTWANDSTSGNSCYRGAATTPPDPWTSTDPRSYCAGVYIDYTATATTGKPYYYYRNQ